MATTLEYALLAGASYISTRPDINKFPVPQGWAGVIDPPHFKDDATGFEAISFTNGTEIVISFAGTKDALDIGDNQANVGLATGLGSVQLQQAAEYYLQVKAANPNATITLTGHSLGGGLASLIGVFFGVPSTTFDQAPFANTAEQGLLGTAGYALDLKNYLTVRGYTEAALADLTSFLQVQQNIGGIPNSDLVTNICVQGEFLSTAPLTVFDRIGTTVKEIPDSSNGVSGFDLHAQSLLAALLQSEQTAATGKALNDVTFKLADLLKMIFDPQLFYHDPNDQINPQRNLLEHLVRHEAGVQGSIATDAMVTRFTADLWKLAQDGGLTMSENLSYSNWNNVSKTLIAFAMQKYYDEQAGSTGAGATLFQDVSGGIRFDTAAVAGSGNPITGAKGYQTFQAYLDQSSLLSPAERTLIKSMLPVLRDWYVQAGSSGMNATDTMNRGAFMLGGNGADALVGGAASDLLVGNAGGDLLQGGQGNDTLLGGAGNDTYVYTSGDGLDTILDAGGQGSIVVDGTILAGGAQYGDARVHRDASGHTYTDVGRGLVMDGNLFVQSWQPGQLGLAMTGPAAETAPQATLSGTANNDDIVIAMTDTADDAIDAGAGQDYVLAGGGGDVIMGGVGSDALDGFAGNDRIYADNFISVPDAIALGNTQTGTGLPGDALSGDAGDDTLIGGTGNDILSAGAGADLLVAGAGDDYLFGDTDWAAGNGRNWGVANGALVGGAGGVANWSGNNADVIYAGSGDDRVWGELGNDCKRWRTNAANNDEANTWRAAA